jgi:hypothetical protein
VLSVASVFDRIYYTWRELGHAKSRVAA